MRRPGTIWQAEKLYNRDERIAITVWHAAPGKAPAGSRCIPPKHRSNGCAVRDYEISANGNNKSEGATPRWKKAFLQG
jgi:hypothetical protein